MRICAFTTVDEAAAAIARLGADPWSVHVMARKGVHLSVYLEGVSLRSALILKMEALAKDAEVALTRQVIDLTLERVSMLLMGTHKQLGELCATLEAYPAELRGIGRQVERLLQNLNGAGLQPIELGDRLFEWGARTYLMGILNVTPDSFSGDGLVGRPEAAVARGRELLEAGADILDIGGESTRPGAQPVSAEEELQRVLPVVEGLAGIGAAISIDTRKAVVAREALAAGAEIINDITSLEGDPEMLRVAEDTGAVVCLMHMRGTPETMQTDPTYRDVVGEVAEYLRSRATALASAGIAPERILVDPGIGFGKTVEHNLDLLNGLDQIRALTGRPILVGPSRKSFLGKLLDLPVEERVWATAGAAALAVARGADIVRVHDVREMAEVVRVADAVARRPRWQIPAD
jgi:dihydropteroate synthase